MNNLITKFKDVTVQNFLSYGNSPTNFRFDTHMNTIITAKNGGGKSSLVLDALCYVLFNAPYRDINLPLLINSINNKNLLVELNFEKTGVQYKVKRGMKPALFEIYRNNELVIQDSSATAYQKFLEEGILGFNLKTFKQIVAIGSANYTPFMNLKAAQRREVIEEVLDTTIYSSMQKISKKIVSDKKSEIDNLESEIEMFKRQVTSQQKLLDAALDDSKDREEEIRQQIETLEAKIASSESEVEQIKSKIDLLLPQTNGYSKLDDAYNDLRGTIIALDTAVKNATKNLEFYTKNDTCPTCHQEISEELKQSVKTQEDTTIAEKTSKKESLSKMSEQFSVKIKAMDQIKEEIASLRSDERLIESTIRNLRSQITGLRSGQNKESKSVEEIRSQIKETAKKILEKTESKAEIQEELQYYQMATTMLKDDGIKARIVANYIPLINRSINEYLTRYGLFVNFELDENFTETIKSRNRDAFTYNSFSEGEKKAIDTSILMAWRAVAAAKNSINTNLIVFDETMDQSLDGEAVDAFIDMLDSFGNDVHRVVISHRDIAPEAFDRHVKIKKVNDFSVIEEST